MAKFAGIIMLLYFQIICRCLKCCTVCPELSDTEIL